MSHARIYFEWIRDSFVGFALVGLAGIFCEFANAVMPFDYPDLYMLWFMIGMLPFCKFANWRRIGEPITWSLFWALAPLAAIVTFLPRGLSVYAHALIVFAICVIGSRFWTSQSQTP